MCALVEFLIDERRQLLESLLVAFAPGSQKLGHVAYLRFPPLSAVLIAQSRVAHRCISPRLSFSTASTFFSRGITRSVRPFRLWISRGDTKVSQGKRMAKDSTFSLCHSAKETLR